MTKSQARRAARNKKRNR